MESENLKKLKELTPKLKMTNPGCDFIEYQSEEDGTFIGFGLHKEPAIAVQRVFMSKGTKVPEHQHKEHEYCLVYKGKLKVKREFKNPARMEGKHSYEKEGILCVGDGIYFTPNEKHGGEALEDTWVLSTTIPAAGVYPDA